ncbi:MAG: NAD(P)H-dependent oxidoreductase [Candidatus Omnitrophica bacterium]|nr:NAD(P)H-dependent oxidoreductase [Candidatus Omnitrophota bacterium]
MKAALIFYSFSGNTKRVIEHIKEKLVLKSIEVETFETKPLYETGNFFKQCFEAVSKTKPLLAGQLDYDLREFDFILVASPVWAFNIAPALRSYLDKAENIKDKKIFCLLTYGSGTGSQKALKELKDILRQKGANPVSSVLLAGHKTKNKNYLEEKLKAADIGA